MRQRGERGFREDERDIRSRERSFGQHRPGMGGDWERGRGRSNDEAFDELENRGYGGDYRRGESWESDYNNRGGFGELDEGRFQGGRQQRNFESNDWDEAYSPSRSRQSGDNRQVNPYEYNRPAPGSREISGRYSQESGRYGRSQGGGYGRFGTWGYEGHAGPRGPYGQYGEEELEGSRYRSGQQGMHSGKGPQGYQRSDARIQEDLCDLLTEHSEIDASNIDVKVASCNVTLSGTVESRAAKRLAEDIAEGISGVQDVRNELRVQRNQGNESGTAGQHGGSDAARHKPTK